MYIERVLNGTEATNDNDVYFQRSKDSSLAEHFLKKHPTAKIVVVIDTHCFDSGWFIWTGDSPETYQSCSLLEVSMLCCLIGSLC